MKKFDQLEDLYPRPAGRTGQDNGAPQGDEIPKALTDDHVVEAYKVPWDKSYGHLYDATDDITDAIWGMGDGRRDIRQLKMVKEMPAKEYK